MPSKGDRCEIKYTPKSPEGDFNKYEGTKAQI
jgi:hypothetical protein